MDKKQYVDGLVRKLTAKEIDRRQFMMSALATGMTASAATALAGKAEAATPQKGGHITMGKGHGSTTDTLDPGLYENGFTLGMTFGFNGYLTEVGADGAVHPSVAESWEASADAATWTFKLRKGVEFHNGKSVTAEDVVTSINHHRGEDSTSAAKPLVDAVTDVKADGDNVVITLSAGNADFPYVITDYHIPVQPAKDGKMDWRPGTGCGAYKMTRYEPGVLADFERFGNHWSDEVGHFDSAQIVSLLDPNARTTSLVSGDVDAIDRVETKVAGLMSRKPGVNVHSVAGTKHYTFPMRCDVAPFDDVNVRRALKHAVKRDELVDKVLHGYGEVGNDVPIGSGQKYFNSEMPQNSYDPDKAKYYLKQAGMSSLSVDLSASDGAFPGAVDAAVLVQNSAKDCGIEVNVVREPGDGYWSDVWMQKPWCACYWGGRPVEDLMFSTAYQSGVAWNDTFWSNARFDELLIAARAELDENKRREMYYEMQDILRDEGGALIPFFASYVFALSDAIGHGAEFASNWDLDGERWMERWWRKA